MIRDRHALAGQSVTLNDKASDPAGEVIAGVVFRVEDYWQNIAGQSWMDSNGNPAALKYAMRSALTGLPMDNDVVYGKVGGFGHLVHVSELGDEVTR